MVDKEPVQTGISSALGGWKQAEGRPLGTFTIGEPLQDFTTPDFSEHTEQSRVRWDFSEWAKVKIKQLLKKK